MIEVQCIRSPFGISTKEVLQLFLVVEDDAEGFAGPAFSYVTINVALEAPKFCAVLFM